MQSLYISFATTTKQWDTSLQQVNDNNDRLVSEIMVCSKKLQQTSRRRHSTRIVISCIVFFLFHECRSLADALTFNGSTPTTTCHESSSTPRRVAPKVTTADEETISTCRSVVDRRIVLSRLSASALWGTTQSLLCLMVPIKIAHAEGIEEPPTIPFKAFVSGRVLLPSDYAVVVSPSDSSISITPQPPPPALYVTCRPDRPDNVPNAILSGSRGKPPPVLVARYENPSFPFDFTLTTNDLTVEGLPTVQNNDSSSSSSSGSFFQYWWSQDTLIVSARLDSDGIAATRSPDDLVGRGVWNPTKTDQVATVALQGRGPAGKFVTGGSGTK
jgi:hypothetical protein